MGKQSSCCAALAAAAAAFKSSSPLERTKYFRLSVTDGRTGTVDGATEALCALPILALDDDDAECDWQMRMRRRVEEGRKEGKRGAASPLRSVGGGKSFHLHIFPPLHCCTDKRTHPSSPRWASRGMLGALFTPWWNPHLCVLQGGRARALELGTVTGWGLCFLLRTVFAKLATRL